MIGIIASAINASAATQVDNGAHSNLTAKDNRMI
jgi:hypothetical protein